MRAQDKQAEKQRLKQAAHEGVPWKKWGPYLSERQWGGVRENVDRNVEAWNDVTHDQSRSRAYISGEDGIAGWCDEKMLLCFALGLWNGKDPILKERMFGLTNSEGNHGEDVKEYYFYVDSTPTHAYASMLYKYPQAAFPYERTGRREPPPDPQRFRVRADGHRRVRRRPLLGREGGVREDRSGGHTDPHHRDEPRARRGHAAPGAAALVPQHLVVGRRTRRAPSSRPAITPAAPSSPAATNSSEQRFLYCEGAGELLFTDNETNRYRLWGQSNPTDFQKDGINDHIVTGRGNAVNPARKGTKSAFHSRITVAPGQSAIAAAAPDAHGRRRTSPIRSADFDQTFVERKREADEFYREPHPAVAQRGRHQRRPPGLRRAAVDQAGLRL